ncbi:hypothetical protein EMCRGX_G035055 [Ephydatia muelleri]
MIIVSYIGSGYETSCTVDEVLLKINLYLGIKDFFGVEKRPSKAAYLRGGGVETAVNRFSTFVLPTCQIQSCIFSPTQLSNRRGKKTSGAALMLKAMKDKTSAW